ncbi:MAG: SUMF1/EgtB/PvdO family nonheme iron enzyme, partial [Bryobacteraceae bacterium]
MPSRARAAALQLSRKTSVERPRATSGSTAGMVKLDGGPFLMGTDSPENFPADGEGPVREIRLDPFWIDARPVTNAEFAQFARATGYRTESERFGCSIVFRGHIPGEQYDRLVDRTAPGTHWWCKVNGAD